MDTNNRKLILLHLINANKLVANSHKLILIMEREFKLMDNNLILEDLRSQNLVSSTLINGVYHYALTPEGSLLLEREKDGIINVVNNHYPHAAFLFESNRIN